MMKLLLIIVLVAGALAADHKCPPNQHYNDCGTLCPVTCENYKDPPVACFLMCYAGCECDEGYVKATDGSCIKPEECPDPSIWDSAQVISSDRCDLAVEKGEFRGFFDRFYYDKDDGQCRKFVYLGCGGNGNNFKTKEECESACGNRAAEVCGENERYSGCGTACPLTCENYDNPPKICPAMCKIGCECESGFVRRADGKCVRPAQCPNRQAALDRPDCDKAPETGLCDAYFQRYYYDQEAGQCKKFVYGGCGGNRNNFKTEDECYNKCGALRAKTRNACEEDKVVGSCKAAFARFYFNKNTGHCEPFIYGGCDGNSNNFLTLEDCEDVCIY